MELSSTATLMQSADYRDRFRAEYIQTKIRRDRLSQMLVKWDANTLDFEPTCPRSLLLQQRRHMDEYLHCLEVRAELECIDLS